MKKNYLMAITAVFAFIVLAAANTPPDEHKAKNLKVLPKDISHEELDKVMDSFKAALGVKCNFCHAQKKDDPKHLDFASDENHHKGIARDMMRMTMRINKKYFKDHKSKEGEAMLAVSCITCHNGSKHPVAAN